jgi:hypothetical protein
MARHADSLGRDKHLSRAFLAAGLLMITVPNLAAQETVPTTAAYGDDELRIREIFSSHLPGTMKKNSLRLSVHPHLGDFDNRDYLRVSTGLRYGLTRRWEIGAGTDAYFSHGLGDLKCFDRYGLANLLFGTKVNLGRSLLPTWESAAGMDFATPVDHPPTELTDGLRHFSPYLSFSRRLQSKPHIRLFWSVGSDLVRHSSILGEHQRNQFDSNSVSATLGTVWDRRRLHYTFEASVATTRVLGRNNKDSLSLRPGVLWEIPTHRGAGAQRKRSNWIIGAGLKTIVGPDGTNFGASAKLRVNLDLKSWLRIKSDSEKP